MFGPHWGERFPRSRKNLCSVSRRPGLLALLPNRPWFLEALGVPSSSHCSGDSSSLSDSAGMLRGRVLALLRTGQGPDLERTKAPASRGAPGRTATRTEGTTRLRSQAQVHSSGPLGFTVLPCTDSGVSGRRSRVRRQHQGCEDCKVARPHSALPAWAPRHQA